MRIGLGCMQLSTDPARDEARALATIDAAYDAGIRLFDTARAYGLDEDDLGHNERLLARALAGRAGVRVVTKGGMQRPFGRWEPDGRAKAILSDCEESLQALGGVPIDLYLLHAPDPKVPLATSVRALASLVERGLVRRIGLSNVTRAQLDAARDLAPISAVEVALGWRDDAALRGGVVARCADLGIEVIAHRPLGGAKRIRSLGQDRILLPIADKHDATPAEIALAALLELAPCVTAIPGATRPETARSAARAASIALDADDRAALSGTKLDRRLAAPPRPPAQSRQGEVVLLMGIQGCGKTDLVASFEEQGYERLNRDAEGGTMRALHRLLDERLAAGASRVVLDNTYVTRASRREAIETAWRHGLLVRGVWIDAALAQAQVNVVLRMLAAHGRLLEPQEMKRLRGDPAGLAPHAQYRLLRTLERPAADEGFRELEIRAFARRPSSGIAARLIALDALARVTIDPAVPTLVFGWQPKPGPLPAGVEVAICGHPAGPPICWCRPPLPGLVLAFAHARGIDLSASTLTGTSPAHRSMAEALGCRYESVDPR